MEEVQEGTVEEVHEGTVEEEQEATGSSAVCQAVFEL